MPSRPRPSPEKLERSGEKQGRAKEIEKEQPERREGHHGCTRVEAERTEHSRRGLRPTGLNASERLRKVKTETCSADLATARVLVT